MNLSPRTRFDSADAEAVKLPDNGSLKVQGEGDANGKIVSEGNTLTDRDARPSPSGDSVKTCGRGTHRTRTRSTSKPFAPKRSRKIARLFRELIQDIEQTNFETPQCSIGTTQSRPFPARAENRAVSAGQYMHQDEANASLDRGLGTANHA